MPSNCERTHRRQALRPTVPREPSASERPQCRHRSSTASALMSTSFIAGGFTTGHCRCQRIGANLRRHVGRFASHRFGVVCDLSHLRPDSFCRRTPGKPPPVTLRKKLPRIGEHLQYGRMELARQIAALPVRHWHDGSLLVLLITSRGTGRWLIPKGWPWPDCEEWVTAREEAREEAGVLGKTHPESIGSYTYDKRGRTGVVPVQVTVYRLDVTEELATWPECDQRRRS